MKLSIVTTLYRSEVYIDDFYRRMVAAAEKLVGNSFELIFVNDGSPDKSLDAVVAITTKDDRVTVIDLSRNFGHHKAMMTGLAHAEGDHVYLIDSDLEEDPEWLTDFAAHMKTNACDVVYGMQEQRKGGVFEQFSGEWFYRFFKALTGIALPPNVVTGRLMTKRYVKALVSHQEREVFIAGLWYITGFDQQSFQVRKHSTSETTYTFRRKMSLLVNSVTSFSNVPLIGIFYTGLAISILALGYIAYLLMNWMFLARPLSGWTSVMASIWLIGGMIISFIGVLGIYLSKIFSESKQRPYTIIRQLYGKQ